MDRPAAVSSMVTHGPVAVSAERTSGIPRAASSRTTGCPSSSQYATAPSMAARWTASTAAGTSTRPVPDASATSESPPSMVTRYGSAKARDSPVVKITPIAPDRRVRSDRATGSGPGYPCSSAIARMRARSPADSRSGRL